MLLITPVRCNNTNLAFHYKNFHSPTSLPHHRASQPVGCEFLSGTFQNVIIFQQLVFLKIADFLLIRCNQQSFSLTAVIFMCY